MATVKAHYTDASSMDIVLAQGAESKTVSILPKSQIVVDEGVLSWDMAYVTNSGGKDYITNYLLQLFDGENKFNFKTIREVVDYLNKFGFKLKYNERVSFEDFEEGGEPHRGDKLTVRACDNHTNGGGCRFCGSWFFYETDEDAAAQKEMADWIALCKKAAGAVNASEAEYRKVFEEISAKLDLRNALEYVAAACYLCNTDWPHNNIRVWRYTGEAVDGVSITDGKWRFATRDMDFTMSRYDSLVLPEIYTAADTDMFSWVLSNYVVATLKSILRLLTHYHYESLYP